MLPETCNGLDDDLDGVIDNGVRELRAIPALFEVSTADMHQVQAISDGFASVRCEGTEVKVIKHDLYGDIIDFAVSDSIEGELCFTTGNPDLNSIRIVRLAEGELIVARVSLEDDRPVFLEPESFATFNSIDAFGITQTSNALVLVSTSGTDTAIRRVPINRGDTEPSDLSVINDGSSYNRVDLAPMGERFVMARGGSAENDFANIELVDLDAEDQFTSIASFEGGNPMLAASHTGLVAIATDAAIEEGGTFGDADLQLRVFEADTGSCAFKDACPTTHSWQANGAIGTQPFDFAQLEWGGSSWHLGLTKIGRKDVDSRIGWTRTNAKGEIVETQIDPEITGDFSDILSVDLSCHLDEQCLSVVHETSTGGGIASKAFFVVHGCFPVEE